MSHSEALQIGAAGVTLTLHAEDINLDIYNQRQPGEQGHNIEHDK